MPQLFRVLTWNIHKGVQGIGPAKRLEIRNIGHAIAQMDADVVCLQEVRFANQREAKRFAHWPDAPQADFLAPEGYQVAYRSNAQTQHGEHGNAALSRWPMRFEHHADMSDHRFEQRGLLHVSLDVAGQTIHLLVLHLGLVPGSRQRQIRQVLTHVEAHIPSTCPVVLAGDFNDWGQRLKSTLSEAGFAQMHKQRCATFPSRLPLAQLDAVYARGLPMARMWAPRGRMWQQMSDHLPLVAEFELG